MQLCEPDGKLNEKGTNREPVQWRHLVIQHWASLFQRYGALPRRIRTSKTQSGGGLLSKTMRVADWFHLTSLQYRDAQGRFPNTVRSAAVHKKVDQQNRQIHAALAYSPKKIVFLSNAQPDDEECWEILMDGISTPLPFSLQSRVHFKFRTEGNASLIFGTRGHPPSFDPCTAGSEAEDTEEADQAEVALNPRKPTPSPPKSRGTPRKAALDAGHDGHSMA
ncbi:hypothetical protein K438DRAFT_1767384 [Mycena galopus ATCC 62051]|nr:hypothetical protein K438DRAFT_1767384 [Mycena galopus ATCC 62051]